MLKTQSAMKAKNLKATGENIVSERNSCKNDRFGSLINIVDSLNANGTKRTIFQANSHQLT
jgi:hypothetical protein